MTTATVSPNAKAVDVPLCDNTDAASLEAWYGNFGFAEHWRKCVLANCREMIRAQATLTETKLSEARIDDLARTHALYISFLTEHLDGRRSREQNVLASNVFTR